MVNKAELRQFLTQYFNDNELEELCFDYFPDLLNDFTAGMTKSQKAIALIGYCERRGRLGHLLSALSKLRPEGYKDQFGLVAISQAPEHAAGRNPNQIFLSHAHQDAAFARELAGDLRDHGFEIWMAPESIEPGEKWVDAIERGLERSGIFVLAITPHAVSSKWVRDESNYAMALQNRDEMRLFTLLVGDGPMPPLWSVRQHISFREDYDEGLQQLLAALRPDRKEEPPPAAAKPASRKRRAPVKATAAVDGLGEAAQEARAAPESVVEKPQATPSEDASPHQPEAEPVAAVTKTVEQPPLIRAPEPAVASTVQTKAQQPFGPIGQTDPTQGKTGMSALPGKPLYFALGAVAFVAVIFIGWQFIGAIIPPLPDPELRTVTLPGGVAVEQVFVPAGSFMMGIEDLHSDEQPVHKVTLDAFWLDRTEVTNAMYAECVDAGACRPPSVMSSHTRGSYYGNAQYADYPVIRVSRDEASDFCDWAGGRLPTEAEWEYAARGPDSFEYPWGNQFPSCDRLNMMDCVGDTSEVGSYPTGASWVGALDMAGNVWEWVNDWYGNYGSSPQANPTGPASGEYWVLRGGAWSFNAYSARSTSRWYVQPVTRAVSIGFRCAQE